MHIKGLWAALNCENIIINFCVFFLCIFYCGLCVVHRAELCLYMNVNERNLQHTNQGLLVRFSILFCFYTITWCYCYFSFLLFSVSRKIHCSTVTQIITIKETHKKAFIYWCVACIFFSFVWNCNENTHYTYTFYMCKCLFVLFELLSVQLCIHALHACLVCLVLIWSMMCTFSCCYSFSFLCLVFAVLREFYLYTNLYIQR